MVDLINHIESTIGECVGRVKSYGLCRLLIDDNGERYPATLNIQYKKVTPDDKWKVAIYHRLMDGAIEVNEELSFGRSLASENTQSVRMVVLVALSEGEEVIDQVIDAMPDTIVNVDYKSVVTSGSMTLIRDRAAIWEQEWGQAYADKYQLRYNIYALEYSINYIKCADCVCD